MSLTTGVSIDPAARLRAVRVVVWILAGALLFNLVLGGRGIVAGLKKRHDASRLRREVAGLTKENDALLADIRALRTDPYRIEAIAREQLGLARPGEIIFMFPAAGKSAPSETAAPVSETRPGARGTGRRD